MPNREGGPAFNIHNNASKFSALSGNQYLDLCATLRLLGEHLMRSTGLKHEVTWQRVSYRGRVSLWP
jgi:hypothetical protein